MADLLHRKTVVDGVRLQYLERESNGAAAAAPLLLLHGLLATAETFAELIGHLPAGRRIIALDLLSAQPVHGAEKLAVDFDTLAHLLHRFIEDVGLFQPVIVGHSHGGALTLRLAASQRLVPRALVLMSPAHPFAGYRSHVVNFYLKQPGRALALSIPFAPRWAILRAFNQAAGPKSRIRMKHLQLYMSVLRDRNTLRRVLQMLHTWDPDMDRLRRALADASLAIPTLLIWGYADTVVPITSAFELEKHLQASERVTLPHMGHLLAEEAPELCGKIISDWIIHQGL